MFKTKYITGKDQELYFQINASRNIQKEWCLERREMHVVWSQQSGCSPASRGLGRGLNFLTHPRAQRDFAYGGAEKKRLARSARAMKEREHFELWTRRINI